MRVFSGSLKVLLLLAVPLCALVYLYRTSLLDFVATPLRLLGVDGFTYIVNRSADLEHLEKENVLLRTALAEQAELHEDNRRLRHLLNVVNVPDYWRRITFRISFHNLYDPMSNIFWLAGDKKAIENAVVGASVIAKTGFLGTVLDISGSYVRVLSVTDIRSKIPAYIVTAMGKMSGALLEGTNTNKIKLSFVDKKINAGDKVFTQGTKYIPNGIYVGRVDSVNGADLWVKSAVVGARGGILWATVMIRPDLP